MLFQTRKKPIVFGGPSLRLASKKYKDDFEFHGPVRRGDLHRLLENEKQGCVLITDGVFGESMAVTPCECIDMLNAGWQLFGTSSIGALRAADCSNVGMIGIGNVFLGYQMGYYHSDSDVAVLYEATTHTELSVSYVHADFLARKISSIYSISGPTRRLLLSEVRKIPWFERSPQLISKIFSHYFAESSIDSIFMNLWNDPNMNPKVSDALTACDALVQYYLKKYSS